MYKQVFETANKYHFVHSLALLATPLVQRPSLTGGLLTGGLGIFCGSCYAVALREDRALGKAAPVGGMLFIAAWLSMVL